MRKVSFRKADVEGFNIFYREAGPADAQTLLLLHGFPSASHMFRDLIPRLADRFHVIAPDLPGFGQSDMPDRSAFTYTFHNIARVIDRFTELVGPGFDDRQRQVYRAPSQAGPDNDIHAGLPSLQKAPTRGPPAWRDFVESRLDLPP